MSCSRAAAAFSIFSLSLCFALFAFSQAVRADVYTYDFNSCITGTNCWAYENDSDQYPYNAAGDRNDHQIATAGDYANLATSNNNRWTTDNPGTGDEMFLWLEQTITQNLANISQIDFTFEGYSGSNTNAFSIWALQDGAVWSSAGSWDQVGATTNNVPTNDTTITEILTSNFATYINAGSGLITWGVFSNDTWQSMIIDYVKIDVHVPNATSFTNNTEAALNNLGSRTGQTITITGSDFGTAGCSAPNTVVRIGTYTVDCADVTVWNDTTITFNINTLLGNEYGGVGALVVQVNGGVDPSPLNFQLYPRIISLNPAAGNVGIAIQVIGTHLCMSAGVCPAAGSRSTAANNVTFTSGVQVPDGSITGWTHTQIDISAVPAGAVTGNVVVTSNSIPSNGEMFLIDSTAPVITALNSGPAVGDCSGPANLTFVFDVTEVVLADNDLTLNWEFYSGAPTGVADGTAGMTVGGVSPNYIVTGTVPGVSVLPTDTDIQVWVTGADSAGNSITSTAVPTYLASGKGAYTIAKELVISNAAVLASAGGLYNTAIAVTIESQDNTGAVCANDDQTFLTCTSTQGTGTFWEDAAMTTQILGGAQVSLTNGIITIYYMDTDSVDPDPQITIAGTAGLVDNNPGADNELVNIRAPEAIFYDGFESGDFTCGSCTGKNSNETVAWTTWSDRGGVEIASVVNAGCGALCSGAFYMQMVGGDGANGGNMCDGAHFCTGVSHLTDTTGYNAIQLEWVFSDCANAYEGPDEQLALEFSCDGGVSWISVVDINPGTGFSQAYNVDLSAINSCINNNPIAMIRVWQDATFNGELIYIDEILMTGSAIPVANVDSASQTSSDGAGEVTLQYDLTDADLDAVSLLVEYSFDDTTWYQAIIKSASIGTINNTGVDTGSSSAQITSIPTDQANATFIWDTQDANNENGAFTGLDASVWLRITPIDSGSSGITKKSAPFLVDNVVPVQSNWAPVAGSTICASSQAVTLDTDENAWCRWSLSDDSYTAMANNCTGGGTASHTCSSAGLTAPTDIVYISCRDSYGNQHLTATNEELTYTIDSSGTPPTQSSHSPVDASIITTTSPTITLSLNKKGDCKWSLTDQAYAVMAGDCTGDGTISMSCGASGLTEGADQVFIACADMCGNEDTAGSNTVLNYTVDTTPPGAFGYQPRGHGHHLHQ